MSIIKTLALLPIVSLAGVSLACSQASDKSVQPKINSINVRLFYETSGTLSQDLPANFEGHNTIIGEGAAKEPANDILVIVSLSVPSKEANVNLPLSVKVSNDKGKLLAHRVVKSHLFQDGKRVKAILAQDVGCAGLIKIEASIGNERRVRAIKFNCGE